MRAMVFTAPSTVEMLEVPEPEPAPGEIVLEVAMAGICGSELHGIAQPGFRQPPLVMGHEFAGRTFDGRRVTVNPIGHCGCCDLCLSGRENICRERSIIGVHRAGAFAERVCVPAALVRAIPDSLSWESAAMVEPLANAVHACNLAGTCGGSRVAVIGAGTIGLVSLLASRARGAAEVAAFDPRERRRELARALGARVVGRAPAGEFDIVIDTVGLPETRAMSIERLRPGGITVWLGLMSAEPAYDAQQLIRAEKAVRGSFAYTDAEFGEAIDLAGCVDLSWSEVFPLDEGPAVFSELMRGRRDTVKALLNPTLTGTLPVGRGW